MLDKDQYNQDEYNDYYAQETRGAEISGGGGDEGSGKKIAVIFLLLLLILAVGYFGWKSMDSSILGGDKSDVISNTEEPEAVEEKDDSSDAPVVTSPASLQVAEIAEQVQNIASDSSDGKMNPADIANIVQMVMIKMNKEKNRRSTASSTPTSSATPEEQAQDSQLMASLSGTDVDSLSSISESDEKKKPTLSKDVDIYNKVVLQDSKSDGSDALSQLSDELSSFVDSEDTEPTDNNNYTASITKEVEIREKEMRYYIVKKGDTLGKIAKKFYGNVMEYKKIFEANPDVLRREDKVFIGQKLRIP